jgi:hypothetical protein
VKNILIIDHDLGFVFWLGQALDAGGYETLPAKSVSDAISLLNELRVTTDVLIVRSTLPGAEELAAVLRRAQRNLKVIALVDEGDMRRPIFWDWDASQTKPNLPDETSRGVFLNLIQGVLDATTAMRST